MRYHPWIVVLLACLPAACGQQGKNPTTNTDTASATAQNTAKTPGNPATDGSDTKTGPNAKSGDHSASKPGNGKTSSAHPTDTVVWIGIHARWNSGPGVEYDGNYDTSNQVFVVCSSDKSVIVPRSQVVLESTGGCDTAFSNRVRLMERYIDRDSVKTIGKGTQGAVSAVTPTVSFNTEKGIKMVPIRQTEAARIKHTFYVPEKLKLQARPK